MKTALCLYIGAFAFAAAANAHADVAPVKVDQAHIKDYWERSGHSGKAVPLVSLLYAGVAVTELNCPPASICWPLWAPMFNAPKGSPPPPLG